MKFLNTSAVLYIYGLLSLGRDQIVILDASGSGDPDLPDSSLEGINFKWHCRKESESFPELTDDLDQISVKGKGNVIQRLFSIII